MKRLALAIALLSLASCEDDDASNGVDQSSVTDPGSAPTAPAVMAPAAPMTEPAAIAPAPIATPAAVDPAPAAVDPVPAVAADGTRLEDLPGELGKVLCERMFSCCGPSEAMTLVLGPLLTRDNCPALAPYYFGDYFKKYTLAMVEKRVTYHPERVEACLDRLGGRSCQQFGASLYPAVNPYYPYSYPYYTTGTLQPSAFSCEDLFTPNQAPGELCQNDFDCDVGFCVATLGSDKRCQALSQAGQSCQNYSVPTRCAPGLTCTSSGICRQIGKEGETCYDTYSSTSCESGLYCASGVYPAPATCRPKLADGSVCSSAVNCSSNRCEYNGIAPSYYTCVPAAQPPTAPPLACTGPK
jgi:hypothetical protein